MEGTHADGDDERNEKGKKNLGRRGWGRGGEKPSVRKGSTRMSFMVPRLSGSLLSSFVINRLAESDTFFGIW